MRLQVRASNFLNKVWAYLQRPAILIITLMVLINAGIFFYFDNKSTQADADIRTNVQKIENLAKQNSKLLRQFKIERDIRTDQACELFERDHLQDVQQLRSTYDYLVQLTPDERNNTLNRFIIVQLPKTEQEALADSAPEYCDGETSQGNDIGLPEPDPKIPDRPDKLVALIGERPNFSTPEQAAKADTYQDLRNP